MWKFFSGIVDHITCSPCESYNFSTSPHVGKAKGGEKVNNKDNLNKRNFNECTKSIYK